MAHILKHHPKHRCPGPAGERYEHYSIVYKCPAALEALTDTLTHLAANRVNAATMNASTAASRPRPVIPLMKPNRKIRPIACGKLPRRIVATAIARHITPIIARTPNKFQYAVGRPSGAEELHKCEQALLDGNHDIGILSIDIKAAFSDIQQTPYSQRFSSTTRTWNR